MEALPRMQMLSVELKESAERVEFGPELKQHISQHYMEDASKYNEEIRQLDQLRINACNVTRDFNGISTLKKYYGQLHLLTSRFPTDTLTFSWIDTYDEEPYTHTDVHFEQSCVLYNLATLHSILGAIESRTSEEEMKVACTHFQCAAGAFTFLKDNFQCDLSPDISFELMNIYINTMLGQAQECLLEKSMQDNRKSSLVARISMQVVEYYRLALRGLEDSNVTSLMGSRRSKWWKKTLQIKALHFTSIAYLYMSNQAEEQHKYGERVAYLTHSQNKHNEAVKMSKGQPESIIEALNFAKDIIVGKCQSAKKDNEFIYHESIPAVETLPEIKGASLVKALTFQPYDEGVAGPDIFRKLVPMEAHEASSLYSEEKAKLLRRIGDAIEEKNKNLDQFLSAIQLEQLKLPGNDPERLPQVLLEVCAALSVKTEPIKTLVNSMQELSGVVMDVDSSLKEIEGLLKEEEKQEAEFQKEFGTKSAKSLGEMKKDLAKCQELHTTASQSNTELHKAMQTHMENIKLLASPVETLQAALPSCKGANNDGDEEVEKKMQKLLDKVEEMKTQRHTLEQQLRDQIRNDDVTGGIVTRTRGSMQEFFAQELKKHDSLVTYIEQNLTAQDNILRALTETNAAYADKRKMVTDLSAKREEKIGELISSYTVYDDLIEKSNKGIGFYKKLEGTVSKLLAKVKGLTKANQEERQEKYRKRYPPQRPAAPKPATSLEGYPAGFPAAGAGLAGIPGVASQVGPMAAVGPMGYTGPSAPDPSAPKGPKLSDYWKPKTGRTSGSATRTQPPPSQPNVYPAVSLPNSTAVSMPGQPHGAYSQGGIPVAGAHLPPGSAANAPTPLTDATRGAVIPPGVSSAPQISMAQPGIAGAPQQYMMPNNLGGRPVAVVPASGAGQKGPVSSSQHPVPSGSQLPNQIPHMPPQNVSQSPQQSHGMVPQHPAAAMTRQDSFSSNSSQSPVHVPQPVPSGGYVQPVAGMTPPMQAPASGHPGTPPTHGMGARYPPVVPNQAYKQQPQFSQNQAVPPPSSNTLQSQQGPHATPSSVAPQAQVGQTMTGPQVQSSVPNQSQMAHGVPPASLPYQQLQQPPPMYGSKEHAAAKAASIGLSSQSPHPGNTAQNIPPSAYSSAHLPSSTNTTASNMPGYVPQNQVPAGQHSSDPRNVPRQINAAPSNSGQGAPGQITGKGSYPGGGAQVGNIHMPSQLGNPQHQVHAQQGQWHQQQYIGQQQSQQPRTPAPATGQPTPNVPHLQQQGHQGLQPQPGTSQAPQQQIMPHQPQQQHPGYPTATSQKPLAQQTFPPQNYPQVQGSHGQQVPVSQPHLSGTPQQPHHVQPAQQHSGFSHSPQQLHQQHQQHPQQPQQHQHQLQNQQQPQQQQQQQQQPQPLQQQPGYQVPKSLPTHTPHAMSQQQPQHQQVYQQHQQQHQLQNNYPQQGYKQVPQQHVNQQAPRMPYSHGQPPTSIGQQITSTSKQDMQTRQSQGHTPMNSGSPHVAGQTNHQNIVRPVVSQPYQSSQQQPAQMQHQNQLHHQQSQHQQYPQQQVQQPQQRYPQPQVQQQQQQYPQQQTQSPQQTYQQQQQPKSMQPGVPQGQQQGFSPQHVPRPQQPYHQQQMPNNQFVQHPRMPPPNQAYVAQRNTNSTFPSSPQQPLQQRPMQPVNPVQQISQQQNFEQQRLTQPVLQPMKPGSKPATDLLSTSPDRQNQPLKDVLAPQTAPSSSEGVPSLADPTSNVSVLASIEMQPSNIPQTQPQGVAIQAPLSSTNTVLTTAATTATATTSTSSTTELLASLKLQPALSTPPAAASPTPVSSGQQLPPSSGALLSGNNLATPQAMPQAPEAKLAVGPTAGDGRPAENDPYANKDCLDKFVEEVERLDKYVEGLNRKMLSGPTVIDRLWKELTDYQDRETRQFSIAIARCYSVKNTHPDIMPYDHNRVCLRGARDDYINGSFVQDLVPSGPCFIATQAPLQRSVADFWLMVYEQQASIVVMLLSKPATGTGSFNFVTYWPEDRGAPLKFGDISLSLQSKRTTDYHVERIIHLTHLPTRQMRTITHLQFTAWPEFGVPATPGVLLQFISEVQNYHTQQRKHQIPLVVHCSAGIDRTGVFCLVYTAVQEISQGHGIADIPQIVKKMRLQRKWMVTEKEQLKFSYDAILCYAQHALAKRGMSQKAVAPTSPLDAKMNPSRLNSFDVIMGSDCVDTLISRISKFSVKPNQPSATPESQVEAPKTAPTTTTDGAPASEVPPATATLSASMPATSVAPMIDASGNGTGVDGGDILEGGLVFEGIPEQPGMGNDQDVQSHVPQDTPSDAANGTPSGPSSFSSSPAHPSQKPKSLDQLQANNLEVFSQTLQNFVAPDVVESSTKQDAIDTASDGVGSLDGSNSSLPSILADLTPQNFSIKEKGQSKQRVSKADFLAGTSGLKDSVDKADPSDPFSGIDPLWSLKSKGSEQPKQS
ncbi:tyrosine-protein phosphatase non-receptor type 23-like [Diadema antillarum]|uniref:tyrosine-protein phosphatase non-receptor type 23-like n=1 Tax=Diadema antillarum TaxID=105358 RepID=UPI003A84B9D3